MTFNSLFFDDDSPIMSLDDFNTAIATTCGLQNCQVVQQARRTIALCTEPQDLIKFEEAAAIPSFLKNAVADGIVGTAGEDGEIRQATQEDLDNMFGEAKANILDSSAVIARHASQIAGTLGKLCSSGPETFTSPNSDLPLTIMICGESLAAGVDHLNHPHTTEVEVKLSTRPQQPQKPQKHSSFLFRRRGESQ